MRRFRSEPPPRTRTRTRTRTRPSIRSINSIRLIVNPPDRDLPIKRPAHNAEHHEPRAARTPRVILLHRDAAVEAAHDLEALLVPARAQLGGRAIEPLLLARAAVGRQNDSGVLVGLQRDDRAAVGDDEPFSLAAYGGEHAIR